MSRDTRLSQRRVTLREERTLMRFACSGLALGTAVCMRLALERPPGPWAEQVLPYGLASMMLVTPSGWIKENLSPEERCFRCEGCGIRLDRDLNAAMNLEQLSRTASCAGCKACEDVTVGGMLQPGLVQSTSHTSLKQESDVKYYDVIFL